MGGELMKIRFHSVNFSADIKLLHFVSNKMKKLNHFFNHIVDADAYFKVEPMSNKCNKLVEIRLRVPGKKLIVKKHSKTFEGATDKASSALRRSLLKYKEKLKTVD